MNSTFIKLFESVAASEDQVRAEQAMSALAQIRSVRHQYGRAARALEAERRPLGPGEDKFKEGSPEADSGELGRDSAGRPADRRALMRRSRFVSATGITSTSKPTKSTCARWLSDSHRHDQGRADGRDGDAL